MQERDLKSLMEMLMKNMDKKTVPEADADRIMGTLSEREKQNVSNLLKDPEKLNQLLNSPAAQKILKGLQGKDGTF